MAMDFLWDCALHTGSEGRLGIIPDYEDDMRHFGNLGCTQEDVQTFNLHHTDNWDQSVKYVDVSVVESRDNGVLDIIGGELWEGALILCALILAKPEVFVDVSVLELGSGVGLPGLLVASMKKIAKSSTGVILSDNDPRVCENLKLALANQFSCTTGWVTVRSTPIETRLLDWSIFNNTGRVSLNNLSEDLHPAARVLEGTRGRCETIVGCELCYAPYHARCLADLLRYCTIQAYMHCMNTDRHNSIHSLVGCFLHLLFFSPQSLP